MADLREKLGFDPAELKAKYNAERNKRLREDGNDQYRTMEGVLAHYEEDPYVEPGFSRLAVDEEVEVLIIGGGWGGQLVAGRLVESGISNFRIVERAGDFGGTWYWNRYPGAACDIESYMYMPLLEEVGYVPTEKYAHGPELLEYARRVGHHYDLYEKTLFQTEVTELSWDEVSSRWIATTTRNDKIRAAFAVTASGPLNKPKLPGIPGLERFKGHSFHTSRWDYNYTGGDTTGGLHKLSDKRVAIIGTGATAIQAVPHLGRWAEHLYVLQRTPSSVDVRNNLPTDPEWAKSLAAGWQQRRMDNFNIIVSGGHQDEDLVQDGWTDILRNLSSISTANLPDKNFDFRQIMQLADFKKMEQVRARVDQLVNDSETARKLKPWYNQLCKRPCFHEDYLPTFNRPNVTLVDTEGKGVERITETGIVANGKEYEVDCIIFATGFEVGTDFCQRMGVTINGCGNTSLSERWKSGIRTLHGFFTRGFPNCFIISVAQSGFAPNFVHMLNEQARHIAYVTSQCIKNRIRTIQPTEEAEEHWVQTIKNLARQNLGFLMECTPGYYNNEGRPSEETIQRAYYGGGAVKFVKLLQDWRAAGNFPGLEIRYASKGPSEANSNAVTMSRL